MATATRHQSAIVFHPGDIRVPLDLHELDDFRMWMRQASFPDRGRIEWLDGDLEIDVAPEDLYGHGTVKTEIARVIASRISTRELGAVYVDRTRYVSPTASLSVEPDVLVVLFESLEAGRVRHVPRASGEAGRYIELEGQADLVVECVSDASERKDTELLVELYHAAGVREYWIVDARGDSPSLQLLRHTANGYIEVDADADGLKESAVLDARVALHRRAARHDVVLYRLELDATE